jgi:hypothetical protein
LYDRVDDIEFSGYVDIIRNNLDKAMLLNTREEILNFCLTNASTNGLVLEFGVFEGYSLNYIADRLLENHDRRIAHGFDTFNGLPENWTGNNLTKGYFCIDGYIPQVRNNVKLHNRSILPF